MLFWLGQVFLKHFWAITMVNYSLFFIVFTLCVLSVQSRRLCTHYQSDVHNVIDYGAIGDGDTDDTKAFKDAWKATCKSSGSPTMHIPHGKKFLVQPLTFTGNCKFNNISIQIDGEIMAPENAEAWECHKHKCKQWIKFDHVNNLFIYGSGTINGQGSNWWDLCRKKQHKKICRKKPARGFLVSHSQNVHLNGLTFKDSPNMHIAFERSEWVYASDLTIKAPEDSPNTDGIHIQHSKNVYIDRNQIMTGDDCISIGDGSSYLKISNTKCGPGHGISIGSLGIHGEKETVEFVHVRNILFTGTMNGVRIKTWQGGKGYARNIVFENIVSAGSTNPIIIDQFYCPHQHCKNDTSAVHISNVTYNNIYGTSNTQTAVDLACSESVPCTNVLMKDVNLKSSEEETKTSSYCLNVQGYTEGQVFPAVHCLSEY